MSSAAAVLAQTEEALGRWQAEDALREVFDRVMRMLAVVREMVDTLPRDLPDSHPWRVYMEQEFLPAAESFEGSNDFWKFAVLYRVIEKGYMRRIFELDPRSQEEIPGPEVDRLVFRTPEDVERAKALWNR